MGMKKLVRHTDWQGQLQDYLDRVQLIAFEPGVHDCATFIAGAIQAMTGADLLKKMPKGYTTLEAGYAALEKKGFDNHVEAVASLLPAKETIYALAGDVAVVPVGNELALGLYGGAFIYVLGPNGLSHVKRRQAVRAFGVG